MFQGKTKAVTFSYDDGVLQDKRLIKLFNKYGLKATFNINSALLGNAGALVRDGVTVAHCKPKKEEVAAIYDGHEVAAHSLTHPALTKLSNKKVYRQVEYDRKELSKIVGYEVVGFAYPGSTELSKSDRTVNIIDKYTGISYARTTKSTYNFEPQPDLLGFNPTIHHVEWDKLFELATEFISLKSDSPKIFYIWGHSYEFDILDDWNRFEEFCRIISNHDDVFYGTNSQVLLDEDLLKYLSVTPTTPKKPKFLF